MAQTVSNPVLREIVDGSLAFFREARKGSANVEQAKVGAQFAQRAINGIGMDLRLRLAERRLKDAKAA